MDYNKHRRKLNEYLQHKGVDTSRSPTQCPNPSAHSHGDSKPSFTLYERGGVEYCECKACGIGGGIYDMIGYFEGLTDFADQYAFAERFFGNASYNPPPSRNKKRSDFQYNQRQMDVLEAYLRRNPASERWVRKFLADRANYSTGGGTNASPAGAILDYPEDTIPFFLEHLFYWPGLDIVRYDLSRDTLYGCGIPQVGQSGGQSIWTHSGIVLKLGQGYKLHYYEKKYCNKCGESQSYREAAARGEATPEKLIECKKYEAGGFCHKCPKVNTTAGRVFPMPLQIDTSLPVILVEGEMDALSCVAAGLKNVFATGGTSGLTGPKVEEHLLNVPEIILMFDGDEKGRKASGIEPLTEMDSVKVIPQTIRKAGYVGKIRLAELPQDRGCNDPDALVIAGKSDVMLKAIENAKEYVPSEKPKKTKTPSLKSFSNLSMERLKCVLRKIEKSKLDAEEVQPFITACKKAFANDETAMLLKEWGATQKELNHKGETSPVFLLVIANKYLSRYLQRELEKQLTPIEELLCNIVIGKTKVTLDFEELKSNPNAQNFVMHGGVRSAALMLANILDGRIIYNAAKNDKKFYFFDGHIWRHVPDIAGVIYNTLLAVVSHFAKINRDSSADDETKKKERSRLMDMLRNIEKRTLRIEIQQEFAGLEDEGVYHNSDNPAGKLHFDGEVTRETLTLADGVLDFSGKELVFRKAKPEEFRSRILDYKIADVEKGGPCEEIWKFMRGNFKNDGTLQTLMYYLSIIPSRTYFKYGGFWIGKKNSGKSTTARIIRAVYQHLICSLDKNLIVPKGKVFANADAPSPQLARLPGCGAAFVNEPEDGAWLNVGRWKELTGGDTMVARGLNEAPKEFINTAQIIINTNHMPKYDSIDDAVTIRGVVIPFLVSHDSDEEGTMSPEAFVEHLRPEFPAFIRLLAEYYIRLKNEHKGKIPISEESKTYKQGYVVEIESALTKYVNTCITFEPGAKTVIKDVYEHYMEYNEFDDSSIKRNEALSHYAFSRRMLKNYKDEISDINVRMQRDGRSKAVRCFLGLKIKSPDEIVERHQAKGMAGEQPDDEGDPF